MYKTIEADIENGKIMGSEVDKLPARAHVLITLMEPDEKVFDFSALAGQLAWKGNAVAEQRKLRDEW